MENNNSEWGIAMEGCEEPIQRAFKFAIDGMEEDAPLSYIEIGVGEGRTISEICKMLNDSGREFIVVAVDIKGGWSLNEEEFYKNTRSFSDKIELNLQGSPGALKQFSNESIFAIMIDGDHSKEAVIEDFKEADRILIPGGIILFHDSGAEDQGKDVFEKQPNGIRVREAIDEIDLSNYTLLEDHPGVPELNGRGIYIVRKNKEERI